jgi:hypothetical protein
MARSPGELVARGTRSVVRAYGAGAVIKIPDASTPECWIEYEAADDLARQLEAAGHEALLSEPREGGMSR